MQAIDYQQETERTEQATPQEDALTETHNGEEKTSTKEEQQEQTEEQPEVASDTVQKEKQDAQEPKLHIEDADTVKEISESAKETQIELESDNEESESHQLNFLKGEDQIPFLIIVDPENITIMTSGIKYTKAACLESFFLKAARLSTAKDRQNAKLIEAK